MNTDRKQNAARINRIEWTWHRSVPWGCILAVLFFVFAPVFTDAPVQVVVMGAIAVIVLFIRLLLTPTKIAIDEDRIVISWIFRTTTIARKDILDVQRTKLVFTYGPWYRIRIIQNKLLSIRHIFDALPMYVTYDQKPYYNLEPERIYDITEEIQRWIEENGKDCGRA